MQYGELEFEAAEAVKQAAKAKRRAGASLRELETISKSGNLMGATIDDDVKTRLLFVKWASVSRAEILGLAR